MKAQPAILPVQDIDAPPRHLVQRAMSIVDDGLRRGLSAVEICEAAGCPCLVWLDRDRLILKIATAFALAESESLTTMRRSA